MDNALLQRSGKEPLSSAQAEQPVDDIIAALAAGKMPTVESENTINIDSIFAAGLREREERKATEAAERQKEERRLIAAAKEKARLDQLEAAKKAHKQGRGMSR